MRIAVFAIMMLAILSGLACSSPATEPTPPIVPQVRVLPTFIPVPPTPTVPPPMPTAGPSPTPTLSMRDLVPPELIATTAPVPIATIQPPFSIFAATSTPEPTVTPPVPPFWILSVASDAFEDGEPIPQEFTCDGDDESPPLSWSQVPEAAQSFAVIVDDPDAPFGVFTHWVLYNLPSSANGLPQGIPQDERLENDAMQGVNDFRSGNIGYRGPCPPQGNPHRYQFSVYVLDTLLDLEPGASKQQVLNAMRRHVLGEGMLTGTYGRQ